MVAVVCWPLYTMAVAPGSSLRPHASDRGRHAPGSGGALGPRLALAVAAVLLVRSPRPAAAGAAAGAPDPSLAPGLSAQLSPMGPGELQALYAWPSRDASYVNLVLTVSPFDDGSASFGPGFQYVFHVAALPTPTAEADPKNERLVICQFEHANLIECWVGKTYLRGNPSASTNGLKSDDGNVTVWAGRRSDPLFFNGAGLGSALTQLRAYTGSLPQCPAIAPSAARDITTALRTPATDRFADTNVLALALTIQRAYVGATTNNPFLAIWASTHRR